MAEGGGTVMIEFEWLAHGDPQRLLALLPDHVSERKLRLFLCACCRPFVEAAGDGRLLQALDTAERAADGRADEAECAAVEAAVMRAAREAEGGVPAAIWVAAATATPTREELSAFLGAAREGVDDPDAERLRQCALLRELFGNPFRPRRLEAAWLRWNDRAVPKLARAVYDDGRFSDLPILADALEEAGCDDADLLGHCRGGGHVRGCWAVDLLLGQQ
jgi:hypothetical protein